MASPKHIPQTLLKDVCSVQIICFESRETIGKFIFDNKIIEIISLDPVSNVVFNFLLKKKTILHESRSVHA